MILIAEFNLIAVFKVIWPLDHPFLWTECMTEVYFSNFIALLLGFLIVS